MIVNDLMHEFELGVWKAVIAHLIRILFSLGQGVVDVFNERSVSVAYHLIVSQCFGMRRLASGMLGTSGRAPFEALQA